MTVDLMKYLINKYDGSKDREHPSLRTYVFVKDFDEKIDKFLANINAKTITKTKNHWVIEINEELYRVVVVNGYNLLGRRVHKAYIDDRLEDEIITNLILPCMSYYCEEVKIF